MGSWLEEAAASFSTRYTSRSKIVVWCVCVWYVINLEGC